MIIAITGVGAVTALGRGADALFDGLCQGRSGLGPVAGGRGPTGPVDPDRPHLSTELALEAAREALGGYPDPGDLAVVGATTSADMSRAEPAWRAVTRGERPSEPRDYVWVQLCHVPTAHVADAISARGPRLTLSTACTSGAAAVGVAADLVAVGRAPAALAFGVDALCDTTVHGFASLGLYDPERTRPFAEDRKGLNIGEGAGALLLEPLERALQRGAPVLAMLEGYGNTSDGYRLTAPDPAGVGAEAAIRQALGERDPSTVGYVCAHATGTPLNDQAEADLLTRLLPAAWVSGIKGAVGHTLGGAGAIEAVVAVLAVHRGRVPPHVSDGGSAFPELALATRAMDVQLEAAVSVNFAFGGNNTALVVTRWP